MGAKEGRSKSDVRKPRYTYPSDEAIIEAVRQTGSTLATARHFGIGRESLALRIRTRPALARAVREAKPPRLSTAERSRRYRERHLEKRRAANRVEAARKRRRNPEAARKRDRDFYQRNAEHERKRGRAKSRTQATRVSRKAAYQRNRPRHLARVRDRYLATRGGHLAAEYGQVLLRDPCSYCGEPSQHIDHIEPVSQGGSWHWANLTASCASCNMSKHADSLLGFLARKKAAA